MLPHNVSPSLLLFLHLSGIQPGMTKCFVAGLRWASAENIRIMNNEFALSVALKQSIQKTPDLVLNIAGLLGLIFETFAPLLFLHVSAERYRI